MAFPGVRPLQAMDDVASATQEVNVDGGGATNDLLCRMLADLAPAPRGRLSRLGSCADSGGLLDRAQSRLSAIATPVVAHGRAWSACPRPSHGLGVQVGRARLRAEPAEAVFTSSRLWTRSRRSEARPFAGRARRSGLHASGADQHHHGRKPARFDALRRLRPGDLLCSPSAAVSRSATASVRTTGHRL